MKTLKALKITSILNGIFCLFCIASTVCFAISHYQILSGNDWRTAFSIAIILIYGWVVNPTAPISFLVCLILFLIERKQPENRQLIGKKWIWILVWPLITSIFYFTASMLSVAFTCGI